MHQHPRTPPVTASPARSPQTNPMRSNNPRDQESSSRRSSSDQVSNLDVPLGTTTTTSSHRPQDPIDKDNIAKLNQVIQNYFCKAALIILQCRIPLPPAIGKKTNLPRLNKWFNIELEESDALSEVYQPWRTCDVVTNRPPAMIIEVFINASDLASNQSLVIHDEFGKRWDVEEAVRSYYESTSGSDAGRKTFDVVLERWQVRLGSSDAALPNDLGVILPKVYKNSIVLFRSLFTMMNMLPAWRLGKKSPKPRQHLPKLRYHVYREDRLPNNNDYDGLAVPLLDAQTKHLEEYDFGSIDSPAGPFTAKVTYRSNCDFHIENSEAILSSQFIDEDLFRPSLGRHDTQPLSRRTELGSLPQGRRQRAEMAEQAQAYGSLSTFHNTDHRMSSSPLSALRAARDMNQISPTESPPIKNPPDHRMAQGSRSSLRSEGAPAMGRRTSVSFMPFKSPSLSASPSPLLGEQPIAASPRPIGTIGVRPSALTALAEARNPTFTAQHTLAPQNPVPTPEGVPTPVSSSPRPTPRYSSSFGHRRARLSTGGSKGEDDNNSSGRASVSSSNAPPGSGVLAEGGGSSGSINTDDDNISDFLKMLDQKKDLKSFRTPSDSTAADAPTRRTAAALSKYSRLRDSNAVLSDSMSSSMLGHRSSSSSSRQLSSVPPMVAGTSMSTASSPGERMSPRTPHTPAIPSRLSANSIVEYGNQRNRDTNQTPLAESDEPREVGQAEGPHARGHGTGAIDIPTSPRVLHATYRRSSSVAQQHRPLAFDEDITDILPFGLRSASLGGNEEREPLSLSTLLAMQEEASAGLVPNHPANTTTGGVGMSRQRSSSSHDERNYDGSTAGRGAYRPRIGRGSGRGSSTSLGGDKGTGSGSSDTRGGRYSYPRTSANFEDEEPLLFAMSELGIAQQGRRSLEEGGRGTSGGAYDSGTTGDSSSKRGNRRGPSWS